MLKSVSVLLRPLSTSSVAMIGAGSAGFASVAARGHKKGRVVEEEGSWPKGVPQNAAADGFSQEELEGFSPVLGELFDVRQASRAQLHQLRLKVLSDKVARFPGDTGSSEVQVARLTERIRAISEHLSEHSKDHHSRRGLMRAINNRRSLLDYLRRTNYTAYINTIQTLGLRR